MTRDEALKIMGPIMSTSNDSSAERALNVFVALGMVKLDEPKSPMEKLETALRMRYFKETDIINLQDSLAKNGLEIVEITKK